MRNWMVAKATYDRSMGEALCARLDALILRNGVDPTTMPEVPTYPNHQTKPCEPEELPYEEEDDEDEEEDDK